jgi:hypothetical protein
VGTVTVTRSLNLIDGEDRNAFSWAVTFESLSGDLPNLRAFAGRLNPLSSFVKLTVSELVSGSGSYLIYDGVGIPEVRSTSVTNITSDMTYSFKVTSM